MKKNNFLTIVLLMAMAVTTITSCVGLKQKGNSAGPSNKLYETFYLEDGVTQHFVKPLSLENNDSKEHSFDFIFRKGEKDASLASINLTVFSSQLLSDTTTIKLLSSQANVQGSQVQVIFNEKKDDLFKNRISFKVPYDQLLKWLNNMEGASVSIKTEEQATLLTPSSKTAKKMSKLRTILY